jgi:phage-related protein
MPPTRVVLFRDADGSVPLLNWFAELADKPRDKCVLKLRRLEALGYELRRPEADYLRDGIYELRVGLSGVNYRMLYFFHENVAAVVSHGFTKQRVVPPAEIELAVRRKAAFLRNPLTHTAEIPDV